MPDLFLEVMQRTGFARAFTHLSERQAQVEHFETSLCAALVAETCNIGIEAVSRQDVRFRRHLTHCLCTIWVYAPSGSMHHLAPATSPRLILPPLKWSVLSLALAIFGHDRIA